MENFIRYVSAGCISFTFSCLFYLIFSVLGFFPSVTDQMIFNMFFLSLAIILLIYLTHLLPIENSYIARLLELFSVTIVLIGAGFSFKMFPFTTYYVVSTLIIGALTYFIVIIVIYIGDLASAKRINTILQQRNEVHFDD